MAPAPLPPSLRGSAGGLRFDAKTITALVALVSALSGAIELRVKVGTMSERLDRVESQLQRLVEERIYARTD